MLEEEGTVVAKGNHVVPKGVAVEELDGGKKKLSEKCPEALQELLEKKGLLEVYEKFVKAVVDESHTRSMFGKWKDVEFVSIIDIFRDDFADKGVKVALCKRKSGSGTFRWLEFIDVDEVDNYVPQFDVANLSGQVIKTVFTKIKFPSVEELKTWGKNRDRLREKVPIYVQQLLEAKNLESEYKGLVEECAATGGGSYFKTWNVEELKTVVTKYQPIFEAKGVSLFVSIKEEYVSHGQYGGHTEYFRWIEFVDREEQPNYHPQRDAEGKKESCVIS